MKNTLLKTSFIFLIILIVSISIQSQEAYKIDEATKLRCDFGEINGLFELTKQLQSNPENNGAVIVFGPQKGFAIRYTEQIKNWLKSKGFSHPEKISYFYGGFKENPLMEFWIVPKNAENPKVNPLNEYKYSTKFDTYSYQRFPYCDQNSDLALKIFANELK